MGLGTTPASAGTTTDKSGTARAAGGGPLQRLWSTRVGGPAVAVALVAAYAVVSAWLTPRGPATTTEALAAMVTALLVGVAVGLVTGRRWFVLMAWLLFVGAFELARASVVGLTVDGIHLGSFYGMLAFALGRGLHGVLALVPMGVGVLLGVWWAARLGHPTAWRPGRVGRLGGAVSGVALVAIALVLARPASTAPVVDSSGTPVAGSVAELVTVPIGGHDQSMMIRGRSVDDPILLYLTGGPGGTDLGAMRLDERLEQDFVVVTWDQRGAGTSYPALDPTDTLTVDQMVSDTIDVTTYLRERFGQDEVYLVGQSWGSTLGVLVAQQRPDLYAAFVGVGQMVSQRETDTMFWEDTVAWADETGDSGLADTLRRNGPPPYDDVRLYEPVVAHEHDWNAYPEFDPDTEMPAILMVPEYSWMDRFNAFRGFLDTNAVLYPQLQGIDFRRDVPRLDLPYYMVLGEHEARGRAVLADEWFAELDAPAKSRVVVDGAGHRPNFDRPGEFAELMSQVVADTG